MLCMWNAWANFCKQRETCNSSDDDITKGNEVAMMAEAIALTMGSNVRANKWILYSGSTWHMTNWQDQFINF